VSTVQFKPRDIVTTPSGRMAKVTEILRGGERRVKFFDNDEVADFKVCHLTLMSEGKVQPWRERTL